MARTSIPAPAPQAARSAADAATTPAPAPVAPAAGDSLAAAVLAALSAEPGGATVAVIAARAGISTAAARQALTAHEKAAQGRRVIKAAASGRRAPATRPGALRDLVEEHLRKFPEAAFTPHQVGKVLTGSAGAVANALDKLVSLGTAEMVTDKPCTYRLAAAPPRRPPRPGGRPAPEAALAPDAAGDRGARVRGPRACSGLTSADVPCVHPVYPPGGPRSSRGPGGRECGCADTGPSWLSSHARPS
jgi:hypothetical protein